MTASGALTKLFQFGGVGNPPHSPASAPVQGADGNFYGNLVWGGVGCTYNIGGCGGIYKYSPATGKVTILYVFPGGELDNQGVNGDNPSVPLIQATDGSLYGTAPGGPKLSGVIYKISTSGQFSVLYHFCSQTNCLDGGNPLSLIQGTDGNLYGVTQTGGATKGFQFSQGTLFRITLGGKYTVLHNFCQVSQCTDGAAGINLLQGADGQLYGTASGGLKDAGGHWMGVIFRLNLATLTYTPLHQFDGTHGGAPSALVQNTNGILYGDTRFYGSAGDGVFYNLNLGLMPFVSFVMGTGKVGATVEVLGQNFNTTTAVAINGMPVIFQTHSNNYLTFTLPVGATTGFVTVTTAPATYTSNKKFRVTPQITGFTPASAPVGASVKITGVSLTQCSRVAIGGVAASFVVNSDTQVTATVPAAAKTGKISVTTAGGSATSSATFTVAPKITSFTPTSGKVGTLVIISGTTFTGATSVTFGGVTSAFTVETSTQIAATVPPNAITGKITVTTPGGTATSSTSFTVTQ